MKILLDDWNSEVGKAIKEEFKEHEFIPLGCGEYDLTILTKWETSRDVPMDKKVIFLSALEVYGNKTILPSHVEFKPDILTDKAFHSYITEVTLEYLHNATEIKVLILRVGELFGGEEGIIADLVNAKKNKEVFKTNLKPSASRDFIYIKDLLKVLRYYLEGRGDFNFKTINVSSGKETNVIKLAEKMGVEVGFITPLHLIEWQRADLTDLEFLELKPEINIEEWIKEG